MKILIFGASGKTGRQVIVQGLQQGHQLTAFVRNKDSLKNFSSQINILEGSIANKNNLKQAIHGQDIVISVLGNKTSHAFLHDSTTISEGIRHIITVMKKEKVGRLLFVGSFGVNENIFLPEKLFIRIVLRNIFADVYRQEKIIKESGLAWTIVHPARLIEGVLTKKYQAGTDLFITPFSHISRADVANFLLSQLNHKESFSQTLTISY